MGLPYITAAQAEIIARKVASEGGSTPEPTPGGGTQLYLHTLTIPNSKRLHLVSTRSTNYSSGDEIASDYYSFNTSNKVISFDVVLFTGSFATNSEMFLNRISGNGTTLNFDTVTEGQDSVAILSTVSFDIADVTSENYTIESL